MELNRREVLAGAPLLAAGCGGSRKIAPPAMGWAAVRAQFALGPGRRARRSMRGCALRRASTSATSALERVAAPEV